MISAIHKLLEKATQKAGIENPVVKLEHPEDITHGDFSSNVAMIYAKALGIPPRSLADKIAEECRKNKSENIENITVAGPGFINFKVKDQYFAKEILKISKNPENFGRADTDKGKKIMVEYTDPNPFKVFHIGHLMANAIGESLSRIVEFSGAKVIRACYQGDVGLHVAKTVWAILKDGKYRDDITYLGEMYVMGNEKYETDAQAKEEIIEINKKIFEKSDSNVNSVYKKGRKLSLNYFDKIYKKLGTKFDEFFFESSVAEEGVKIVQEFMAKGVFEKSDGAVVFKGGVHTRVFITSEGLPTYEAKELGLTQAKFRKYKNLDESIVITANEQSEYFKVIIRAIYQIKPEIASKTKHLSHGILRPSTGKMSSRKGNVVAAEELLGEFENLVMKKMEGKDFDEKEKREIINNVAIAAIKYTILRQAIGGDIIYDPGKAVSFEGDSGPYLQYSTVRASAVLEKAGKIKKVEILPEKVEILEKLLVRFPEVINRARSEYAPHHIATYLIELAGAFNSYYAQNQIIDEENQLSAYRLALTKVFREVMKNGLWVLGIKVPGRM
ncbi:MAG TPA: arginine--tRNA ligase [Candidatus Paceibacterota bacterium]